MSLIQYRYFDAVIKAGSIRKAAAKLDVAPSSIGRQIQQLEHEMGMALLERHANGVIPTPAGLICADYIRNSLFDLEVLKSELDGLRGLRRGNVRICSIEGVVAETLLSAIAQFREQYSGVTFEVTVIGTQQVAEAIVSGDADIGIAFQHPPHADIEMAARTPDPLAASVAPGHPLAVETEVGFERCLDHPIAVPETTFGIRALIDQVCLDKGLQVKPALLTNSIEALRSFARTGAGISLLPNITILRELADRSLVSVPLIDPQLKLATTDIMVRKNRRLPIAVQMFLHTLVERMQVSARQSHVLQDKGKHPNW